MAKVKDYGTGYKVVGRRANKSRQMKSVKDRDDFAYVLIEEIRDNDTNEIIKETKSKVRRIPAKNEMEAEIKIGRIYPHRRFEIIETKK